MATINLLESNVYNQISAGEVVENPSSIVKELVENSIDAGATFINVAILDGGIKSIIISDNGCGMDKTDLKLSILPHATSKIKTASDLDTISTLGFRGEALPSISAVSEIEINSHHNGNANAIIVKAGQIIEEKVTSLNQGTTIKITSLFFNTPARFKFLKSPKREESNVTKLILELIFANPNIGFKYTADEQIIYQTDGSGLQNALYSTYDAEFADNMIYFRSQNKGYIVEGFTARPATTAIKNNRKNQIIIVNGRSIVDPTISAVVQNAYGEKIMKRTFPSFILDIIAPFDLIDVNVHPNKKEVRFAESRVVSGVIYHSIQTALQKDEQATNQSILASLQNIKEEAFSLSALPQENENVVIVEETQVENKYKNSGFFKQFYEDTDISQEVKNYSSQGMSFSDNLQKIDNFVLSDISSEAQQSFSAHDQDGYRIVGQIFDTYLLIEASQKLFIIDQHAAHERILYNRIMDSYNKNKHTQDLLIPYDIELEDKDIEYIRESMPVLKELGFDININSEGISVVSIPAALMYLDLSTFFHQFVQDNNIIKTTSSEILKDKIAKTACKSAIKGGDKLTDLQIKYVLDYFVENNLPLQCPHGRPTVCEFTKNDIEKMFKRSL